MIRGGFTGPLICSGKDASFKLAGSPMGSRCAVYDYRYRFLPQPRGVMHGGQKLVVFCRGKYLGQYALSPPPFVNISVIGSKIILTAPGSPESVEFTLQGRPPAALFVNGETATFHR
ncbi:hypothetical protein ABDK56_10080 [Sphingomonas sp. ASV193]|uniref:hypothetical protein n=1 Tax=Sphingomonas sp. ASV193 TaxID=3144405 RepID=UPI0032E9008B